MSTVVELDRLLEVAAGFRTTPMLLTTDPDGRPRAAAVGAVDWVGQDARVAAGRKSYRNAMERPLVSLLWPAPPEGRFALLVDAEAIGSEPAEEGGGLIVARATSALLHVLRSPR